MNMPAAKQVISTENMQSQTLFKKTGVLILSFYDRIF